MNVLFLMSYESHGSVVTWNSGLTNEINTIPDIGRTEKLYVAMTERNENNGLWLARSEHKDVDLIENFVNKFATLYVLVADLFHDRFTAAKDRFRLQRHRHFLGL